MKAPKSIAFLFCSLSALLSVPTSASELSYPTLNVDGTTFSSVCGPTEQKALKEQFVRYKYKNPADAWRAVMTLLCSSKSQKNTRYVRNMMATRLLQNSYHTGQDHESETIKASNEVAASLFASGIAYDASIAKLPGDMFRVLYLTNEVCVESRTFKYDGNKWTIVGKGEACD